MCSPELGKKSKKEKKKPVEHYISLLCFADPAEPICIIFGT